MRSAGVEVEHPDRFAAHDQRHRVHAQNPVSHRHRGVVAPPILDSQVRGVDDLPAGQRVQAWTGVQLILLFVELAGHLISHRHGEHPALLGQGDPTGHRRLDGAHR
ncbi:MAG: hypothetical protein M3460_15040 [Actinomycetota bacterium]|nr:hypothetical protein [Actinomycetota bacterium]